MRNIIVELSNSKSASENYFELVERKGIGHPDTLADGIAEAISCGLCREYVKEFGKILHHNVDKLLICGGGANADFGGGEFTKPIYILLSGRATDEVDCRKIQVSTLAVHAAREYLRKHTRFLNVEENVIIDSRIAPGSKDLVDVFMRGPKIPFANDTSFGVGYAPLSDTEKMALYIEKRLNSKEYKAKNPAVGEDIKVMALRVDDKITLTIACAIVSKYVHNVEDYRKVVDGVRSEALAVAAKHTKKQVEVAVNTADDYKTGSVYITLTGLSCEMGDDGSVGRGNRTNGLITPCRPMTLEAAAGKNPVNHVGKIYSVLAVEIAKDIIAGVPSVRECEVKLLSQIGKPVDQPKSADVKLVMHDGEKLEAVRGKVSGLVDGWLENITEVTNMIVEGKVGVYY
ncbi:MAG: methionine adenosyltransferase [Candidatus Micrarchaeota archaeon]|nr:methionine adenosyltransferase [Candidatus Micrarchaeota archaeon]